VATKKKAKKGKKPTPKARKEEPEPKPFRGSRAVGGRGRVEAVWRVGRQGASRESPRFKRSPAQ
jgi:hypothetical protein